MEPITSYIKHFNNFPAEYLREILHYDPETGVFTWRAGRGRVKDGAVAGSILPRREGKGGPTSLVGVRGRKYPAHRLAWVYMTGSWPPLEIDHIDTDSLNNRWDNLRLATTQQNGANRGPQKNNSSGFKGVCWNKANKAWRATTRYNGVKIQIGDFKTPEAAYAAYCAKFIELHGEFARVA